MNILSYFYNEIISPSRENENLHCTVEIEK